MRAFFGLSPDTKTKLAIEAWRKEAFPHLVAPVPVANFHVTLAFLGQVSTKQLDALCKEASHIYEIHTFGVLLDRLGYWPKPKALWLGCQNTQAEHLILSKRLIQIANTIGLQLPKKDDIAHLTLARKCLGHFPVPLIEPNFTWHNAEFHLFESVSGKKGVAYHIRHTWTLSKQPAFKSV